MVPFAGVAVQYCHVLQLTLNSQIFAHIFISIVAFFVFVVYCNLSPQLLSNICLDFYPIVVFLVFSI